MGRSREKIDSTGLPPFVDDICEMLSFTCEGRGGSSFSELGDLAVVLPFFPFF